MKILHYSDSSAKNFLELYRQCDILISTGDLTQFDFAGLEDISINMRKPSFGVYGNHDSGLYLDTLGITNLHNKVSHLNGLSYGGFQGCLKYKEGNYPMFFEEDAKIFADTFPKVDILLLHAGPKGMLDDPSNETHVGSENIRRYVLEKPPKYVFLGHQYSNAQMSVGPTNLYRTFGARIIEID